MKRWNRKPGRGRARGGMTLLEVAVAILLIILVATTATGAMRVGLRTLSGTEDAARAASAIREFREYTFDFSTAQLDALDGTEMSPVMGTGAPLPEGAGLRLRVEVTPVSDTDPGQTVQPGESQTRLVDAAIYAEDRLVLEARWLATQH